MTTPPPVPSVFALVMFVYLGFRESQENVQETLALGSTHRVIVKGRPASIENGDPTQRRQPGEKEIDKHLTFPRGPRHFGGNFHDGWNSTRARSGESSDNSCTRNSLISARRIRLAMLFLKLRVTSVRPCTAGSKVQS